MSDDTMTLPEALRLMADNMEAGRGAGDGMEFRGGRTGEYVTASGNRPQEVLALASEGRMRKAPSYIEVAGVKVPEPIRRSPEHGESYWFVDSAGNAEKDEWFGWDVDEYRIERGNVFANREAAKARAKAERLLFGLDSTTNNE